MDKNQFIDLGLTNGEARVYVALVKVGLSTVGPIVKESGVAYSKIYQILDRLLQKGLVSYILQEKTRYYQATEPHRIVDWITEQQRLLKEKETIAQNIIKEVKTLTKLEKNEAEIYTGFNGLTAAYSNLLQGAEKGNSYYFFYIPEKIYDEKVDLFFSRLQLKFKKSRLIVRGISNEKYRKSWFIKQAKWMKMRFTNTPLPSNVDMCENKVLFTSWRDSPIGVLVHSKEIYENFRIYFETVWKASSK